MVTNFMRKDQNYLERLQNKTTKKDAEFAQRLRLTLDSEEEMHGEILTLIVNVVEEEQHDDAQHEHGTKY
jgi:hypothetical protein